MVLYKQNNLAAVYILNYLQKCLKSSKNISILDIGCGRCEYWIEFLKNNPHVIFHGIDINKKSIEKARLNLPQFSHQIFELNCRDLNKLNGKYFDVIISKSALEHIYDKETFLKQVFHLMHKKTQFLISWDYGHFRTGNPYTNLMNRLSQLLARFGLEKNYNCEVDLEQIKKTTSEMGFELCDEKYFNIPNLKGLMKSFRDNEKMIQMWFDFELEMNRIAYNKDPLHTLFGSVLLVLKRRQ